MEHEGGISSGAMRDYEARKAAYAAEEPNATAEGSDDGLAESRAVGRTFLLNAFLIAANVAYGVFGAWLYRTVEIPAELAVCEQRRAAHLAGVDAAVAAYWGIVTNATAGDDDKADQLYRLLDACRSDWLDRSLLALPPLGTNCSADLTLWTWPSATLFALTITSTIGYGHVVPITVVGKMLVLPYAVVGLPLMVVYLGSIGEVFGALFAKLYAKVCCCGCCGPSADELQRALGLRRQRLLLLQLAQQGAVADHQAIIDCPALASDQEKEKWLNEKWADEALNDYSEGKRLIIPLTISLIIATIYVTLGGLLFSNTENWDLSDAAYFSFVTVATIGFGDLVPGVEDTSPRSTVSLVVTIVYIVFGLEVLAVCFAVMQEAVTTKAAYIANLLSRKRPTKKPLAIDTPDERQLIRCDQDGMEMKQTASLQSGQPLDK